MKNVPSHDVESRANGEIARGGPKPRRGSRVRRQATIALLAVGFFVGSAIVATLISAQPEGRSAVIHQAGVHQAGVHQTGLTTPRRPTPSDRFDFRGEHAGVIYTPSGWRSLPQGAGYDGLSFSPVGSHRGLSVYVPHNSYGGGGIGDRVVLGTSYEIVHRPKKSSALPPHDAGAERKSSALPPDHSGAEGRYEMRAREVVIPGEYVQVFHPAVYEVDADGVEQLVEKEERSVVPKVRIVLERVWVSGRSGGEAR